MELYALDMPTNLLMRTPVRFDFDPTNARSGHPAAHLTINSAHCRIACVAPMHVHRFLDFVFRHFYPKERSVHRSFFDAASRLHIGKSVILEEDRRTPHLMWSSDSLMAWGC